MGNAEYEFGKAEADYEEALTVWQSATSHLLQAIPPCAAEITRRHFPEAKVLRCLGDSEGSDFTNRFRPVAVLGADGNILADDDEHQSEAWDTLYDRLLIMDYLPELDPEHLSHAEIDCETGEVTLVDATDWVVD